MTPRHVQNSQEAFKLVQRLAAELSVLERKISTFDDPRWEDYWQLSAQFEAVERSARRMTGWRGCMFGPDSHCPEDLPVSCMACAGTLDASTPDYVFIVESHVETDSEGKKWLHETLEFAVDGATRKVLREEVA